MRSKLLRVLAIGLGVVFSFTAPAIALADVSLGGNTNSGGGTGVGSDPAYAHKFMAYPENQGYRISIVDENGDRVANSIDIVNYVPDDFFNLGFISNTNSMNGGGAKEYLDGFNQYKNYFGWDSYNYSKPDRFLYSNGIKTEEWRSDTWEKTGVPNRNGKYGTITTEMYSMQDFKIFFEADYFEYMNTYKTANPGSEIITPINFGIVVPSKLEGSSFKAGGAHMKSLLETPILNNKKEQVANVASRIVDMVAPALSNRGQAIGGNQNLFRFIRQEDNTLLATPKDGGRLLWFVGYNLKARNLSLK